uniref:Nucleolar complex-associated protein 3 n=1 Tax=Schizosaccharomyces pombe TaxID=4896 RepID=UPI0022656F4A|nr:Chain I, Nucleolar complex-associated protein 3 [Schizosaccharomyces pombe]8ESR_I Chain I, Nucleolar complex-associated protein 3 [Schizosaccharomyces pombe]
MAARKNQKSPKPKVASSKLKNIKKSSKRNNSQSSTEPRKNATSLDSKKTTKKGVALPEIAERELTQEDIEFFNENPSSLKYLSSINPEDLGKKVEKGPRPDIYDLKKSQQFELDTSRLSSDEESVLDYSKDSEDEQDYELRPRVSSSWNNESYNRLPIKTKDGLLQNVVADVNNGEEFLSESESEASLEIDSDIKDEKQKSLEEQKIAPEIPVKQQIKNDKEALGIQAQQLLEEPVENLHLIRNIFEKFDSPYITIKKLSLLTLLAVFRDIIPGYKIRPLSEEEQGTKLSKEVAQRWEYEQTLLKHYAKFLQTLETILKSFSSTLDETQLSLYQVAVRCCTKLIEQASHFNLSEKLFALAVRQISHKTKRPGFDGIINSLKNIFEEDNLGKTSLKCVTILSRMFKQRNYDVLPDVYDLFLSVNILNDMKIKDEAWQDDTTNFKKRKKDLPYLTKKARKNYKETKKITQEMKEADAVITAQDKEKYQSEILKIIFITYFKTLQLKGKLIGNALEGVARLSHLLNIEFLGDLLQVLRELVMDDTVFLPKDKSGVQATREALLTVSTAFEIASAQGVGKLNLDLDLGLFVQRLYKIIFPFSLNPDADLNKKIKRLKDPDAPSKPFVVNATTEMEMLLKCFQVFFFKSKNISSSRLSSFSKRLAIASMQLPEHSASADLALLKKLLSRYSKLSRLLTSEEQIGDGIYNPFIEDPDLSNSSTAVLYEPFLLKNHYSPAVSQSAKELLKSTSL